METKALQRYLHEHIPLTAAMGVNVEHADESRVVLSAPLAPNINHRNTAFGGSIGAIATVAAWAWLHWHAARFPFSVRLVVRSSRVEFLLPIEGDFTAICERPPDDEIRGYEASLLRRGKGRIELHARLEQGGQVCATFTGTFVAIRPDEP
ncbi:YiiD C-terminal domain-containing protein [Fimbriimonas ginsengisoli]|uniref:Thioesterase domain protein n=1 Tax=Fimbriimonas ginsengisoli Gsoil 348 TaxID=661478 RepID=A0A068NZ95_FIMGI|nr:YiiD C-terminal domain-containing protein [Fimbriimonas ginsengisoli]AIE88184.1 thioesterase domain protein [Fimbriimonas ginsengisoli Gsoil 348]